MRVADVTPSCDLAAKCHLKREREVYKHVLTLALLDDPLLFLSLPPAPVCFCCERGSGTIGVLEALFPFPKCTFFILIYLHQAGAAD